MTEPNFLYLYSKISNIKDINAEIQHGHSTTILRFENDIQEILPEFDIDLIDFQIPKTIKIQYCLYNGIFLRWSSSLVVEKGFPLMGQIKFPNFIEMLNSSIEHNKKKLYLFDDFFDKWKVYFALGDNHENHQLFFANFYENNFYPLRINVETYYKKAYLCCGLTNWQEFFFEDLDYESDQGLKSRFKKEMELLFPDVSWEEFIS